MKTFLWNIYIVLIAIKRFILKGYLVRYMSKDWKMDMMKI